VKNSVVPDGDGLPKGGFNTVLQNAFKRARGGASLRRHSHPRQVVVMDKGVRSKAAPLQVIGAVAEPGDVFGDKVHPKSAVRPSAHKHNGA
jgi:hypothetical protein